MPLNVMSFCSIPDWQHCTYYWVNHHKEWIREKPVLAADDNSLAAWVIANNQLYHTNDSESEQSPAQDITHEGQTARTVICAPLRDGNHVFGAVAIQHTAPNAFDTAVFKTFMAIAAQIAVIIKNARLHEQAINLGRPGDTRLPNGRLIAPGPRRH